MNRIRKRSGIARTKRVIIHKMDRLSSEKLIRSGVIPKDDHRIISCNVIGAAADRNPNLGGNSLGFGKSFLEKISNF